MPDGVRDRDVIQDFNGRVYVVLGSIQPRDKILCFLKYVPDESGAWVSNGVRYRRVFWGDVGWIKESLSELPPDLVVHDSHFGTELLEVPREHVLNYFSPEARLREILEYGPRDRLESMAQSLSVLVTERIGIGPEQLGVAGSVLWRAHDPCRSDLNMNVYGLQASHLLHENIDSLMDPQDVHRVGHESWMRKIKALTSGVSSMTDADIAMLSERRRLVFHRGTSVGITPVLYPDEAPIVHGSEYYRTISDSPVTLRLEIVDDTYGLFTPSIYSCIGAGDGARGPHRVERLMIYEGAFKGLLRSGDIVEVTGSLQSVIDPNDHLVKFHQIMVGTKSGVGKEGIRILRVAI